MMASATWLVIWSEVALWGELFLIWELLHAGTLGEELTWGTSLSSCWLCELDLMFPIYTMGDTPPCGCGGDSLVAPSNQYPLGRWLWVHGRVQAQVHRS